jgi:hypothetical protein
VQSTTARAGLLVALVAVAVVLFIVLSDDDDSDSNGETTTATTAATGTQEQGDGGGESVIVVKNGEPVGGVQEIEVDKGERVSFQVRLDQPAEEVHVHGYEIEEPAEKSPVEVSFPATIDGVFEIELHRIDGSEAEIAELRVNP